MSPLHTTYLIGGVDSSATEVQGPRGAHGCEHSSARCCARRRARMPRLTRAALLHVEERHLVLGADLMEGREGQGPVTRRSGALSGGWRGRVRQAWTQASSGCGSQRPQYPPTSSMPVPA